MKKTLLLVPVALLLASCGGSKPSGKELLFGKTFKYSDTIIEKNSEIVSWLNQNKDKINWEEEDDVGSEYARMEYIADGEVQSEKIDKPDNLTADSIYEKMNNALENDRNKLFDTFSAIEIDFNKGGTGEFRIVEKDQGERKVKYSGPITFADLDGSKHGEGVEFSGTISEVGGKELGPISGTFEIDAWENNKISQTLLKFSYDEDLEGIISNAVEFKFPLKDNGDDDYTINGLINLLPANE